MTVSPTAGQTSRQIRFEATYSTSFSTYFSALARSPCSDGAVKASQSTSSP